MTILKPELLAPAGSLEKMRYAYAFGADAVYAGAPQFSLRARENEFKLASLMTAAEESRQLGKKFYLTTNILAHNRKLKPFARQLDELMACRPDALIMADPGLIMLVKERYPEAVIHLSVQANTMNWATVRFWLQAGVSRIILSRELGINEIKEIKDHVPEMELESFVHGAICIAHSGRCLLSNYFNHRDANQGACTNACRWSYKLYAKENFNDDDVNARMEIFGDFYLEEKDRPGQLMRIDEDEYGTYIMNAKDLMAIEYLDQMRDAGISSFKIEGRTKSIYYLSLTVRAYRQAIDDLAAGKELNRQLIEDLNKLHNRGYTPGFLVNQPKNSLQRYDEGRTNLYTQEFGGVIEKTEPNRVLVLARNQLALGNQIEIITPNECHQTVIESMTLEDGENIDIVHGGTNTKVWIPSPQHHIPPYSLVSKLLDHPTATSSV